METKQEVKRPDEPQQQREIAVTVKYVGHETFRGEFLPATTVGEIKLKAMRQFGLDLAAAGKYILQHDGADIKDEVKIGSFEKKAVAFELVLKHEVNKG